MRTKSIKFKQPPTPVPNANLTQLHQHFTITRLEYIVTGITSTRESDPDDDKL